MSLTLAVVGWAAAAALLVAYALVSSGRLSGHNPRYQALNLAGAAGLTVNSGIHQAWPSAALNLIWIAIGLSAVRRAGVSRSAPAAAGRRAARPDA
jgi:hypothetical protein